MRADGNADDQRRRREDADAYAAYCAQPQIAEQIRQYLAAVRPLQAAVWGDGDGDGRFCS